MNEQHNCWAMDVAVSEVIEEEQQWSNYQQVDEEGFLVQDFFWFLRESAEWPRTQQKVSKVVEVDEKYHCEGGESYQAT